MRIQEQKSFTFDNACIVISSDPTSSVRLAATELQYFIHKTTGFCPEIISELPSEKTRAIFVGKSAYTEKMKYPDRPFEEQEYLIDITSGHIVLIGQDEDYQSDAERNKGRDNNGLSPEKDRLVLNYAAATGDSSVKDVMFALPSIYDAQGTCYAVYDFIERFLGVRFFGPIRRMSYSRRKENKNRSTTNSPDSGNQTSPYNIYFRLAAY